MADFKIAEPGELCLIQVQENGRIAQIAMTLEQSKVLQVILAAMSKEQSFILMPEEHDLVLKRTI